MDDYQVHARFVAVAVFGITVYVLLIMACSRWEWWRGQAYAWRRRAVETAIVNEVLEKEMTRLYSDGPLVD